MFGGLVEYSGLEVGSLRHPAPRSNTYPQMAYIYSGFQLYVTYGRAYDTVASRWRVGIDKCK